MMLMGLVLDDTLPYFLKKKKEWMLIGSIQHVHVQGVPASFTCRKWPRLDYKDMVWISMTWIMPC